MKAEMSSKKAGSLRYWALFWLGLLGVILAVDVFLFRASEETKSRAVIAPDAVRTERRLPIEWLGPPYFPSAREGLWVERMLEETFRLDLEPILMDPNAYNRKKPLMIAGGPVPDVIWEGDPISLQTAVKHGFVAELPPELIVREMPQYARDLTNEVPVAWMYSHVDGRNYGLPTFNRSGALPTPGIWRMDWLRKVGIETVPETLEEFEEALRRITHEDPDGNGIDDTYGMSGDISNWWWVAFSEIFGAYGVLPFDWQLVGEKVVWGGLRPEARVVLQRLRSWYAEGLIHPEFVTDSMLPGQTLDRKFLSGKTGYIFYRGEYSNLVPNSTGSFANNFFGLQFPAIVENSERVARSLIDLSGEALMYSVFSTNLINLLETGGPSFFREIVDRMEQIQRETGGGGLGKDELEQAEKYYAHLHQNHFSWILLRALQEPFYEGRFAQPGNWPLAFTGNGQDNTRTLFFKALLLESRAYLRAECPPEVWERLRTEIPEQFRVFLARREVAPENLDQRRTRSGFVDLIEDEAGPFLTRALEIVREAGIETVEPASPSCFSLLKNDYLNRLHFNRMPRVLVPGAFPEGPDGQRGARVWGKAGNILTFGPPVARKPEIAVAVLDMQEALYSDRVLFRESLAGREGVHWEWSDPIARERGATGPSMKPDYVDPGTGQEIDLSKGQTALRRMLHSHLGFFNLTPGKAGYREYYQGTRSLEFERQYKKEAWGLENVLGKSDVVPSASKYLNDLRMRQQTVFAEIIRGSVPLSAFDDFVEEFHEKGGDVLIREANAIFAKQRRIVREMEELLADD